MFYANPRLIAFNYQPHSSFYRYRRLTQIALFFPRANLHQRQLFYGQAGSSIPIFHSIQQIQLGLRLLGVFQWLRSWPRRWHSWQHLYISRNGAQRNGQALLWLVFLPNVASNQPATAVDYVTFTGRREIFCKFSWTSFSLIYFSFLPWTFRFTLLILDYKWVWSGKCESNVELIGLCTQLLP